MQCSQWASPALPWNPHGKAAKQVLLQEAPPQEESLEVQQLKRFLQIVIVGHHWMFTGMQLAKACQQLPGC